jgi:hypothetical protein
VIVLQGRASAKTIDGGEGSRIYGIAEISGHPPRSIEQGTDRGSPVHVQCGDVVMALAGDPGRSAVIDDRAAGAVLARECAALRVTATDRLLPQWLHAWAESQDFQRQVAQHASGGTAPRINIGILAEFTVPLPSLSSQHELAAKIYHFETVLRATTELLRNLQDLRAAESRLAVAKAVAQ